MKGVSTVSLPEMRVFAEDTVSNLKPQQSHATVFGLRGELGAGKTAFVKAVAEALGITEHITSPTFVIQKTYNLQPTTHNKDVFKKIVHIDAYRLQSADELKKIGWEETLSDPENIIFIEWPENVKEVLPDDTHYIDFGHVDETTREVNVL